MFPCFPYPAFEICPRCSRTEEVNHELRLLDSARAPVTCDFSRRSGEVSLLYAMSLLALAIFALFTQAFLIDKAKNVHPHSRKIIFPRLFTRSVTLISTEALQQLTVNSPLYFSAFEARRQP